MNEPYIIKAGEYDPEKHERHNLGTGAWVSWRFLGDVDTEILIVVRNNWKNSQEGESGS